MGGLTFTCFRLIQAKGRIAASKLHSRVKKAPDCEGGAIIPNRSAKTNTRAFKP